MRETNLGPINTIKPLTTATPEAYNSQEMEPKAKDEASPLRKALREHFLKYKESLLKAKEQAKPEEQEEPA